MSELKKKALSGVFWSFLQQFGGQLISFISSIILARILLPEEFGLIAIILVFIGVANSIVDSGLGQSLIRTKKPSIEEYSTVFFYNIALSFITYIFLFLIAPFIAKFFQKEVLTLILRCYAIVIVVNSFSIIQKARLVKMLNFKVQMYSEIPAIFFGSLAGVISAYNGLGVWSLVYMAWVYSIANTILLWKLSIWKPVWTFNFNKFKYHFNFGYKLNFSNIINDLFEKVYVVIIGKYFSPIQVGFYHRAESINRLPIINVSEVINRVAFPLLAEIEDKEEQLKNVYKKILKLKILIIAPVLLIIAALAEPFFRFLFTEKWLPAVPFFQILCWNGILIPINNYNLMVLKLKGRSDILLKIEFLKKIITVLVLIISFQFGLNGLLIGSVLLSIIYFFINAHYTNLFLGYTIWCQIKDLFPSIVIAIIAGITVYAVDFWIKEIVGFDILRLIIGSALGSVIFLFLAYLFEFKLLMQIKSLLKEQKGFKFLIVN